MKLFYMDESGTGLKDKASPFFVLAALGINAIDSQRVDRAVTELKRRLIGWAKPEDFEIKARDIIHGLKLFKSQRWEQRVEAMRAVAQLIAELPCQASEVVVDKRDLPGYIGTDNDLYRIAFWRLLEELDAELEAVHDYGLLMADMRSDLHSSVQDRRLIDAYREWVASRFAQARFIELPWFGFSAFYAGLQLADIVAYLTAWTSNEFQDSTRQNKLYDAFLLLRPKLKIVHIP
jgi:hypothetical protein